VTADFRSPEHDPEGCAGCRPVVFDPNTRETNLALTALAGEVFDAATPAQRRAWHRVTCLNSRDRSDVALSMAIMEALQRRLKQ
jgi:hypothetical protein